MGLLNLDTFKTLCVGDKGVSPTGGYVISNINAYQYGLWIESNYYRTEQNSQDIKLQVQIMGNMVAVTLEDLNMKKITLI